MGRHVPSVPSELGVRTQARCLDEGVRFSASSTWRPSKFWQLQPDPEQIQRSVVFNLQISSVGVCRFEDSAQTGETIGSILSRFYCETALEPRIDGTLVGAAVFEYSMNITMLPLTANASTS